MKVQIDIPSFPEILQNGMQISVSRRGLSWSTKQLGSFAKEKGVYVMFHEGVVKYVGKTDGPSMTFGMRLRREFQETASQGRHIYPKLESLKNTSPITVSFITTDQIKNYLTSADWEMTDNNRCEIFEQVLIQVYKPELQKVY